LIPLLVCLCAAPALAKEPGFKEALDPSFEGFAAESNPIEVRKHAFNKAMGSGSTARIKSALKNLKWLDKGMDNLDKKIARFYADYLKELGIYNATIAAYHKKYPERSGEGVPITAKTGIDLDKAKGFWQRAVSAKRREFGFEEWVVQRIRELMIVLPDSHRIQVIAAIATGARNRDRRGRLRTIGMLNGLVEKQAKVALFRILGQERDPLVLAHVIRLVSSQRPDGLAETLTGYLDSTAWQVRAAAAHGLASLRTRQSTETLIDRLGYEDGRMVEEILAALETLTRRKGEPTPESWRKWLEEQGADWKPSPGNVPAARHASGEVRYFGVRTRSKAVVFCVDLSARGAAVAKRLKRELGLAIDRLTDDSLFAVLIYADEVKAWKKGLTYANGGNKRSAKKFIEKWKPGGPANVHAALDACLRLAIPKKGSAKDPTADTVYFTACSMPTAGAVSNAYQIREDIERRNRLLRLRFHMIDLTGNPQAAFLEEIAHMSRGMYVGPPR